MNKPWSKIRKELERDFLCDSLKGRVRYFATRYHKAPDDGGRISVLVDEVERINMSFTFMFKTGQIAQSIEKINEDLDIREMIYDEIEAKFRDNGEFAPWDFDDALDEFFTNSIDKSLSSSNYLVRMLAIFDRRIGKRTLEKLKPTMSELPEWLQYFYNLRFESEGV